MQAKNEDSILENFQQKEDQLRRSYLLSIVCFFLFIGLNVIREYYNPTVPNYISIFRSPSINDRYRNWFITLHDQQSHFFNLLPKHLKIPHSIIYIYIYIENMGKQDWDSGFHVAWQN